MGIRQRKANRRVTDSGSRRKRLAKKTAAIRKGQVDVRQVAEPNIRKHWRAGESLRQNAKRLGLRFEANADVQSSGTSASGVSFVPANDVVRALEDRAARGEAERSTHLPEGEKLVLRRLIDKYGDNYRRMFRDTRLNTYQHSARELQKRCEKYMQETMRSPVNAS